MPKEPKGNEKQSKKGPNTEALVVIVFSTIAFTVNIAAWAFRAPLQTADVLHLNFALIFFLIAFLKAGKIKS